MVTNFGCLQLVVDLLVSDVDVKQRISSVQNHLSNVPVDDLASDAFTLSQGTKLPLVALIEGQMLQLDLGNKLLQMLKLGHELLDARLAQDAELNRDLGLGARIRISESHRDVNRQNVFRWRNAFRNECSDKAVSSLQLQLEQRVAAINSSTCERGELGKGCAPEKHYS